MQPYGNFGKESLTQVLHVVIKIHQYYVFNHLCIIGGLASNEQFF